MAAYNRLGRNLVVFAALALSAGRMAHAALPERAAVVYSEWGKNVFANEYDKHLKRLGWAFDKYENVRLPELSGKLGGYNLVIATSVANYTKKVKMAPFAEAWRKWLADGGTLLVTDANYGSVLNDWVAAFGPGFESGCALCSAHTKPSDATRAARTSACRISLSRLPFAHAASAAFVPPPVRELRIENWFRGFRQAM